jgi:benzil reductase ((S)-benzoin forming)
MKKVFIITGANRGLGKAIVDLLIENENNFIISISRRLNEEQRNYSKENFYFLKADLSNNSISEKMRSINLLITGNDICYINNASIIDPISKIEDLNDEAIDKIISVNIKSTIIITKYLLRNFHQNKLTFVNISSGAASRAINNWSLYCSSKAFIKMFFNVAEGEYKQHSFFNIDPGVIDTGMQKSIRNSDFPDVSDFQKLEKEGKLQSAKDVAKEIINTIS